jgi:hypothetical protein
LPPLAAGSGAAAPAALTGATGCAGAIGAAGVFVLVAGLLGAALGSIDGFGASLGAPLLPVTGKPS